MGKKEFLSQFTPPKHRFPVQEEAFRVLSNGMDFPTTRHEQWKYTRIANILGGTYKTGKGATTLTNFRLPGLESQRAHLLNGGFHSADAQEGMHVESLAKALGKHEEVAQKNVGRYSDFHDEPFIALNTSFFQDGALVNLPKNAAPELPLHIIHEVTEAQVASNPRNLIVAGPFSKGTVVLSLKGGKEGTFTNMVTEVSVMENAFLDIYLLEDEGDQASVVNTIQVHQAANSIFNITTITQSGKLVRNNLAIEINGEGCETNLNGLYMPMGKQHVDNHTLVDHRVPHCNSNELYKGVMDGQSTGVFNGKVFVRRDAQKTNAFQSNQNIVLTDDATINSKPELEIYADDVKCSHGSTTGQLDEEALFYLRSRALSEHDARNLLVKAFAVDVIDKIQLPALREYVEDWVEKRFADHNNQA